MNILSDKGNPPEMFLAESMKKHRVAGAAFALIRSGELAHTGFCGVADPEENRPVDASTHFEIASLTKTVFARCILQLEDRGLLRLDRPLREYSDEPLPTDDPAFRDVTARDVLTHATGLPNWGDAPLPLRFVPGTGFGYSGKAYTFLQNVVEKITGSRIDVLLQDEIFNPLGMKNAAMIWTGPLNRTLSRTFDADGVIEPLRSSCRRTVAVEPNAAFSLCVTISDYTKFALQLLSEPETIERIRSFRNPVTEGVSWGLGWGLCRETLWHWGDNDGFKAFVILDPATKDGVVIHTNSFNGLEVCYEFIEELAGFDMRSIREMVAAAE
ncbi:serine hydrolase domain-containing protein [Hornefia butyriciproducens]|uniref:Beta-lactamase family protein n=1 Tax=Hornefia butyriciproducens TaxID=2652293 RepID=A0A6L5Y775_9FIRM|nr:serine hydrolase domain-containing protein [Hornefia butyriciproducens]MST52433.1 beta-lactamase family protein [Hornefia butyriciproducens]